MITASTMIRHVKTPVSEAISSTVERCRLPFFNDSPLAAAESLVRSIPNKTLD